MKILFDLIPTQPIGRTRFHGAGEYTKAVFRYMTKKHDCSNIIVLVHRGKPLEQDVAEIVSSLNLRIAYISRYSEIVSICSAFGITRFYSGLPLKYNRASLNKTEFIFTIHGLRPLELPTDTYEHKYIASFSSAAKYLIKRILGPIYTYLRKKEFERLFVVSPSYHAVAVSQHTCYAIRATFPGVDLNRLHLFYSPAIQAPVPSPDSLLGKYGLESKKYFLLINANRWEKNSYRAIRAFRNLIRRTGELQFKIAVAGSSGRAFLRGLSNDSHFTLLPYLERADLECLYKHAFCLLYPTLNEGFGYPPLECMKYGTPVIASAVCSVPELIDSAALFANPYSIMELETRIVQMMEDDSLYSALMQAGPRASQRIKTEQDAMLAKLADLIMK